MHLGSCIAFLTQVYSLRPVDSELLLLPKLERNVVHHDLLFLFILDTLLFAFHGIVLAEVLNVLGMYQVLLACVLIMVLLEVMDLVLILIVTVMPRPETEIGQCLAILGMLEEGFSRDAARVRRIENFKHFSYR